MTQKRAFMLLYIVLGHQRACMPVYIGKSGVLVGWHRCLTHWQTTELDQVYCAWLIKWIIKGEIIQLCLTKWWIISGTSRYWVSIRRYCLVLGGTGSVKTGTAWYYMVQGQHRACMPVYIGKSGDLVGWHRCLTYSQTTEYRATQLVSSIKFKLSHAIERIVNHATV